MRFHAPVEKDEPLNPCAHMREYLSSLSDGTLSGLTLWYAKAHVAGCSSCEAALEALKLLRGDLRTLRNTNGAPELTPERKATLQGQMTEAERGAV